MPETYWKEFSFTKFILNVEDLQCGFASVVFHNPSRNISILLLKTKTNRMETKKRTLIQQQL